MNRVVIVGVGECVDRPAELVEGIDPIGLMTIAAGRAAADAGIGPGDLDAVDVVHQISWRYDDTGRRFAERLGIEPALARYHPGGGESPIRLIHDAALAIARGDRRVSLVVGGEARNTAAKARRAGIDLPWPPRAKHMEHPWDARLNPLANAHGVDQPTFVYPFYENACTAASGRSPAQAHLESAALWKRFADVAVGNPFAWARTAPSVSQIATPSDSNPPIAYPYTRLMVANPTVNQAAAVLLMSEAEALARGIPRDRLIYIHGGAAAREPEDYLARDRFDRAAAQEVVLAKACEIAGGPGFDAVELYSCFPCVPKMAAQSLGLPSDTVPTVTGGLTFFGGPFNDYMAHATAAMVRRLRASPGTGLLYGQGDFVTKHHALVVGSAPPLDALEPDYRLDRAADALRGPAPPVIAAASGMGKLETFTILYDRGGVAERGVAILALADGSRTMARVPAAQQPTLDRLADADRSPIGLEGTLSTADDGLLEWTLA